MNAKLAAAIIAALALVGGMMLSGVPVNIAPAYANNNTNPESTRAAEVEDGIDDEEDSDGADDEAEDDDTEDEGEYTTNFRTEDCTFNSEGRNPFFILEPNYQLVLRGETDDGADGEVVITVLDETEEVDGVETRVVEERESEDGELVEISRNFVAICEETNSVFYFGEDVDDYENGQVVGHEGEWRAGEDNATAGMLMPGTILLGARYHQEHAPDVAMDRAEIIEDDEELETPADTFGNVLVVRESNPLETESDEEGESIAEELKYHAEGVGLIQDENLQLVEHGFTE